MGALNNLFGMASITMSAYQTVQNAELQRVEAELAADTLETQASRKELEAGEVLKIGELNQAEQVIQGRQDIAETKAGYAYSGVKVDSGSTLDVTADKAAWNEYERQKIQYESELESWGLQYDAALLRQEASNTRASGSASSSGSSLQAAISAGKQFTGLFK